MTALFQEIRANDDEASIIMTVRSKDGTFHAVNGAPVDLAAHLTLIAHQQPAFENVIKMALECYKNGPQPSPFVCAGHSTLKAEPLKPEFKPASQKLWELLPEIPDEKLRVDIELALGEVIANLGDLIQIRKK